MSEQIRREFTLGYPLEKVKKAIEDTCRTNAGSYQIQNRNDVFNSYSISLVKMLSVLPVQIQLKKVNDTETIVEFTGSPGPQLSRVPTFVSEMVDPFLDKIGGFVSGKLIVKEAIPLTKEQVRKGNTFAVIFFIIAVGGLIAVLYLIFG